MFTNKKTLLALSVASALLLSGCSDNDNNDPVPPVEEPVAVVVAPEAPIELSGVVAGNVVDGTSFDVVAAKVSFFESGTASTNVVDVDGNVTSSIDSEDGSFTFQLKDGASITQVTAVVVADGYATKTFIIDLSDLGDDSVEVQLGLTSLTADGVAAESTDVTVSGGSSAEVVTAAVAKGKAAASVNVPAGTTFQDADGNVITGSTVKIALTAADTSGTAGALITPEGLNAGSTTVVKKAVAVASVNMSDETGTSIKKFSSPITVNMAVPADKGFATGETLSLSSQNEETGVWTSETQDVTIGDLSADSSYYNASFMTDHLTFFAATTESAVCASPVRFLFTGDAIPAAGLKLSASSSDFSFGGLTVKENYTISAAKVAAYGLADDASASVAVKDSDGNSWFASTGEVALCGDVNVALTAPADISYVSEALALTAQCSNDTGLTTPGSGALVKYGRTGKAKRVAKGADGSYALNDLIEGASYEVSVKFQGTLAAIGTKTYTITADGTDEPQTEALTCDTTTGATGATGGN